MESLETKPIRELFHVHFQSGGKLHPEEKDFENRLITGATFALNEDKMKLLKEKIQNEIYEVSNLASEGPCQAVYQMNVQFFPLSK